MSWALKQPHIRAHVACLHREVARNDAAMERAGGRPSRVTVFHGHKPPNISVGALARCRCRSSSAACLRRC